MSIHQEAKFPVSPQIIYDLLTDESKFTTVTGKAAKIGVSEGKEFTLFGGLIHGRQIELISGKRIVQAWRMADWAAGVYSIVRFTFSPEGTETKLTIDQEAYPDGKSPMFASWHEHLSAGWKMFYLQPFAKHLAVEMEPVVSAR